MLLTNVFIIRFYSQFGSQVDLAEEQEADDLSTTGSATGSVVRAPMSTAASSVISASAISQRDLSDAVHEVNEIVTWK